MSLTLFSNLFVAYCMPTDRVKLRSHVYTSKAPWGLAYSSVRISFEDNKTLFYHITVEYLNTSVFRPELWSMVMFQTRDELGGCRWFGGNPFGIF